MSIKQDRMNDRISIILSELLLREVSDPRLQGVTITEVKLDPELMFADIFVNALGDESRRVNVLTGLKSANGFLRREVGKRIRLRNTPELHFHWDMTLERGERLNQILAGLDIPAPSDPELDDEDFDIDDDPYAEYDELD
ncbi:MAG: 30S ribosome-binding factor RbfA [Chitinophagaceae bacterium]|nr:30S ribosome-binding factor RbfA [Anaerolineae bacterium]